MPLAVDPDNVVSYRVGGVNIEMSVTATEAVEVKDIKDERSNQVLVEIYCRWRCVLNPVTLPNFRIANRNLVTHPTGDYPATTLDAVCWHLNCPRGTLKWRINGVDQLVSPATGAGFNAITTVDSQNGPVPNVVHISALHGVRTWEVVWEVTTWQNRTRRFVQNANDVPVLISHTWQSSETISRANGYRAIRFAQGTLVFDTSMLFGLNIELHPDSFRQWCLPVCPYGFAREEIQVTAESSGAVLTYHVRDEEQMIINKVPDIVYADCLQAFDTIGTTIPNVINQGLNLSATLAAKGEAAAREDEALKKKGKKLSQLGKWARRLDTTTTVTNGLAGLLPTIVWRFLCHVKGTRNATIDRLVDVARRILDHRTRLFNTFHYAIDYHGQHQPEENLLELGMTYRGANLARPLSYFTDSLRQTGDDLSPDIVRATPGINITQAIPNNQLGSMIPPRQRGSRGYALAQVISQQLASLSHKPNKPRLETMPNPLPPDPHA